MPAILPERRSVDGRCLKPFSERILSSILGGLFAEGLIGEGGVLDAGAALGHMSCYLATLAPKRAVHAIEPSYENFRHLKERFSNISNLQVLHAGLGAHAELIHVSQQAAKGLQKGAFLNKAWFATEAHTEHAEHTEHTEHETNAQNVNERELRMVSLDQLFDPLRGRFRGERLAFASIDVEGSEMEVLSGGVSTIRRDAPVLVFELFPQLRDEGPLLKLTEELGYDAFLIDEGCGFNFDCRNALFLPRGRVPAFYESHTLDLAAASGRLHMLNSSNYRKFGKAWLPFQAPRVHRMYGEGTPNFQAIAAAHRGIRFEPARMVWHSTRRGPPLVSSGHWSRRAMRSA